MVQQLKSLLVQQEQPMQLIEAALRSGMTGQIVLHVKEGRIMEVDKTEKVRV